MKISVCIKRVPDTETRVRISDDGTSIDERGVKFVMSPYDEYAVEAGIRVKEKLDRGEVTAVTLGDEDSRETLRSALAMGADRGLLLEGPVTMDGLATAKALAVEVEDADLILFGVKAVDDDQQQIGPMVATLLDRPCVTAVADFQLEDGAIVAERQVEGGVQIVEADLPAVLTLTKGEFEPRYASLKGIMAAKKKPLDVKDAQEADSRLTVQRLNEPPERPEGRIVGEGPEAVPELVKLLREEANVL